MHYKFKAALLKGVTKDTVIKTQDNFFFLCCGCIEDSQNPFFLFFPTVPFLPMTSIGQLFQIMGFFTKPCL